MNPSGMLVSLVLLLGLWSAATGTAGDEEAAVQAAESPELNEARSDRVARSFGSQGQGESGLRHFYDPEHANMVDWKSLLGKRYAGFDKRLLESFYGGSSLGRPGSFNANNNLQDWGRSTFGRNSRSFGSHKTGGLGSGGTFGSDGFQNWRAFFDSQAGRQYRKRSASRK